VRHWIDIATKHIAANTVRFQKGCATSHKRIRYSLARKSVTAVEGVAKWLFHEFGQKKRSEQGSRTSRKPLVNGDVRTIVLLYLLLLQGQSSSESDIKVLFDHLARLPLHCGAFFGPHTIPLRKPS